ncbi:tRNA (adenosine(37)-N6)-threonylcarbamoyltransferase complex transferase subunit TsaD [Allofrancisella guangzhouensis]|uniref:tRNA N6-adenosine threonylcarbamoyltransferase n=1 Tax=Allofrancisella guangzhouensis TaxID=594679 RepID=A0A0A8E910_9GAMM|nr:tRNA (adenosine(37)-N6)-threonylcarbamoyltransferase complex transferase subunit TsaD [Allofrancisella guangzhouensis]AJC48621.1 tRNA threonylcarbamoyladenosine biosynthesis protein Gcp [Allofrancisella guangzhouensis]MBK2027941.1 tRNA (adenosine(37)-N6)-threonylcarbamoyltransferase complex transferase subunit TsaD [Allofrancisella guangzhouensis]MBK2043695.1 tRNA (adenosine(37)-N6)-threonylcarbamoyltransferase complex transferase subunit TsaD [Allofrancisella guangzhouensis]MBK2046248.1 tRN
MLVLGIESSCDETGVALYDFSKKKIIADALYSQINLHKSYGGVVPELASREHIAKLNVLTKEIISKVGISFTDINCIAYTAMPGLVGALMVGATFAKTLGFIHDIDTVAVHHLEGHLLSPLLEDNCDIKYPFIALLVSGGHTQLFEVRNLGDYQLLGESIDDAVGEAFDKTAKLLGMSYPGGVEVANLAEKASDKSKYFLPRPMKNKATLDFSFSGLKTAVLNTWHNESEQTKENKANLCYAFQEAAVDVLVTKCDKALSITKNKRLVVSGGVSANKFLRYKLNNLSLKRNYQIFFPPMMYCTDNGAMIALAGAYRYNRGFKDSSLEINVKARETI